MFSNNKTCLEGMCYRRELDDLYYANVELLLVCIEDKSLQNVYVEIDGFLSTNLFRQYRSYHNDKEFYRHLSKTMNLIYSWIKIESMIFCRRIWRQIGR